MRPSYGGLRPLLYEEIFREKPIVAKIAVCHNALFRLRFAGRLLGAAAYVSGLGPIAAMTPPPVFPARISAKFASRSGGLSMTLANGESFQGRWKIETPGPADPASPDDLSGSWDLVYGPGFFTAHVLGNRDCGLAHITGSQGTPLTVQLCGAPDTKAVAKDGKGNVYKLTIG